MSYTQSSILAAVKAVIDENLTSAAASALSADLEQRSLDTIITAAMLDALAIVMKSAPVWTVDGIDISHSHISWHKIGSGSDLAHWGSIAMPEDMMRLLLFEMSDWLMPVSEPITSQDPRYAQQKSPFRGVRGNPDRPVVALHHNTIEFYSCLSQEATITTALYLAWPKWEEPTSTTTTEEPTEKVLSIPPRIYRASIYQAAALTLRQLGMTATATDIAAIVPALIQ